MAANPDIGAALELQRADGVVRLVVTGSEYGTRIVDLFQQSPLRVLFPRTGPAAVTEAVLINTAGGIAGGDRLQYTVTALPETSITLTSQAAERVYRALNEPARVTTRLQVCAGTRLAWLPQETIVFNGGRLQRETEIDLTAGARLLALEWLVLGRAAHGERIVRGQIRDGWRVRRGGRLIWADTFRATDEVFPLLRSRALLADFTAFGTLIYFGPDVGTRLESVRELAPRLPCYCVGTVVADLMIVRLAAQASAELRDGVQAVLRQFEQEPGGGPLRVPKMWSC